MRSLMVAVALAITVAPMVTSAQTEITLGARTNFVDFSTSGSPGPLNHILGSPCPNSSKSCKTSSFGDRGYFAVTGTPLITLSDAPRREGSLDESTLLTFAACSDGNCRSGKGRNAVQNAVFFSGSLDLVELVELGDPKKDASDSSWGPAFFDPRGGAHGDDSKSKAGLLDLSIGLKEDFSGIGVQPFDHKRVGEPWRERDRHRRHCPPVSGGSPLIDPTPEPSSILLFGTGLLALMGILRRRRTPADPRSLSFGTQTE